MQNWYRIVEELADDPSHEGPLKFYAGDIDALAHAMLDYLIYLARTSPSRTSSTQSSVDRAPSDEAVAAWIRPPGVNQFSLFTSITELMSTQARLYRATIGPTDDEDLGELKDQCGPNFGSSALYMSAILLPIMSSGIVAAIDPALATTLQPWFSFASDDPTPRAMSHPVCQFVIEVLDRNTMQQLSEFTSTRNPDDHQSHDNWTCEAFLKVLYRQGHSFLGLRGDLAQTVAEAIGARDNIPAFVLGLYKREIGDVSEFISQRLHFHFTAEQNTGKGKSKADDIIARADEERDAAERAFVGHFIRYLQGEGHPDHPELRQSSLLSSSDFEKNLFSQAKSKTLRVELLLRALTDSPTLPLDELWCIHFAFPHHLVEDDAGAFFSFHTCTNSVDVLLTDDLIDLLVVSPSVVHAQLLMAPGEYNMI
ncbi:hypothetical protein L226DRAFT_525326 [Lentinus tigrinus ALCF2SS1-7]|uniref:Uncharacterized protein n=1 Tax=Lentinus tigrinus ALCF2SS1-6 TaxID=1328759 RepID=A0A5C2RZ87_9APHY|nr:hypothetical protein L227DRAFT_566057 [Lentinus tigrinus ALCF2SS1-6]RPD71469.1 hypothetical protein L226DRAFT_525326 [Lentinus tigrinus ALCF2SS1-7]